MAKGTENKGLNDLFGELKELKIANHKDEILVLAAVVLMSVGFAVICMGYIIPREYRFDSSLPAREMEKIELHYVKLSYYLDVSIVAGMGCVAAGGLVATALTVYRYASSRSQRAVRDRKDLTLLRDKDMSTYGTASPNVPSQ